ncbi:hypothetical protein [Pyrolobus fumarii]|nr:hypothetical protein [Pyrolobus fumarii]
MMPVYLKHRGVWLRVKEVYAIVSTGRRKRRGKQRSTSTSSSSGMLVAESVERVPLNGMKYKVEIPIASTRVTRFAAQLVLRVPHVTVVIEPRGDDYVAIVYARSRKELQEYKNLVEKIAREVGVAREEEEVEEEVEEVEEEAEEE